MIQAVVNGRPAETYIGGHLTDVVRTRMYITSAEIQHDVGKAHAEFFREVKPAATMVVVSGLVRDDMMVEIEAECLVTGEKLA